MSSEIERIAILEAKVNKLDETICEIKETQNKFNDKLESSNGNIITLTGELKALTTNLAVHNTWHEKQSEKKFNWGQLAIGMIGAIIAILQLINISFSNSQKTEKYIESKSSISKSNT